MSSSDAVETIRALGKLRAQFEHAQPQGVFGEGNPAARLVIVGEAPGPAEERCRRLFVGRAGRVLDLLLAEAGIRRDEIWLTNVVKQRPVTTVGGRISTCAPSPAQIRRDLPWLERELTIVRPAIVLCLGGIAARALIRNSFRISLDRGKWFQRPDDSLAIATFHPSYLRFAKQKLLQLAREDFGAVAAALIRVSTRPNERSSDLLLH